jgi:hypothetical protein
MILSPLEITKHTFQIALKEEFGLPVIVDIALADSLHISVMRQSTLYEFMGENPMPTEPVWTEVMVTLPPTVIDDPQSLYDAYITIRNKILKALEKGRVLA